VTESPGAARQPRSLGRLAFHTFGNLVLGLGVQIVAGIAVGRVLGPAAKGQIAYAGYVLALVLTAAEGLRAAISHFMGPRAVPRPSVWAASLRLLWVLAAVAAGIALTLSAADRAHTLPYIAAAVAIPFALYLQVVNIVYQISHRLERINLQNTLTVGAGTSFVVLGAVVFFHAGVPAVLAIWVLGYIVASLWSRTSLHAMLGGRPRFDRPELVRQAAGFGLKASLAASVAFLALRVDVFIVAAMLAPATLGVYSVAISSGEMIWLVSKSLTWSALGSITTLRDDRDAAELAAKVARGAVYAGLVVAVPLFVLGPWLIATVYGERFAGAGDVLRVVLPGLVLYGADGVLSFYLAARAGRPGTLLILESLALVVCAACTYAGVLRFGAVGAGAANTITYALAIALKAAFFLRETGLSPADLIVPRLGDLPRFAGYGRPATSTTSPS
jgi:O-antigen/teichoic acid export membrane protein